MTNQEAIEMMKAKLECMTRDVSGRDQACNAKKCDECDLCYAQGNMGEQKEWLRMGIEALENQKTGYWIEKDEKSAVCSCCNRNNTLYGDFCKWCGAKIVEPQGRKLE